MDTCWPVDVRSLGAATCQPSPQGRVARMVIMPKHYSCDYYYTHWISQYLLEGDINKNLKDKCSTARVHKLCCEKQHGRNPRESQDARGIFSHIKLFLSGNFVSRDQSAGFRFLFTETHPWFSPYHIWASWRGVRTLALWSRPSDCRYCQVIRTCFVSSRPQLPRQASRPDTRRWANRNWSWHSACTRAQVIDISITSGSSGTWESLGLADLPCALPLFFSVVSLDFECCFATFMTVLGLINTVEAEESISFYFLVLLSSPLTLRPLGVSRPRAVGVCCHFICGIGGWRAGPPSLMGLS